MMKLQQLITDMVTEAGYELVDCELAYHPKGKLVRVLADKEGGVNIGELHRLSKQLKSELLVEFPDSVNYLLEVSSPGLDRALNKIEDYQKFLGREIKLQLTEAVNLRKRYQGLISAVEAEQVVMELDPAEYKEQTTVTLDFNNIAKANLVPKIDLAVLKKAKKDRKAMKQERRQKKSNQK